MLHFSSSVSTTPSQTSSTGCRLKPTAEFGRTLEHYMSHCLPARGQRSIPASGSEFNLVTRIGLEIEMTDSRQLSRQLDTYPTTVVFCATANAVAASLWNNNSGFRF